MKTISRRLFGALSSLKYLVYPELCISCHKYPPDTGVPLCFSCASDVPLTRFNQILDNPFLRHFYGRIPVRSGTALMFFNQYGKSRQMLHELKYMGRSDIGFELGKWLGKEVRRLDQHFTADIIIPVPLHRKKFRRRGYNQSEYIARGMSEVLTIPTSGDTLIRTRYTPSQTGMDRLERQDNLNGAFELKKPDRVHNCHVVIIDDVLTTGATLESAAATILQDKSTCVSLFTIAMGAL